MPLELFYVIPKYQNIQITTIVKPAKRKNMSLCPQREFGELPSRDLGFETSILWKIVEIGRRYLSQRLLLSIDKIVSVN